MNECWIKEKSIFNIFIASFMMISYLFSILFPSYARAEVIQKNEETLLNSEIKNQEYLQENNSKLRKQDKELSNDNNKNNSKENSNKNTQKRTLSQDSQTQTFSNAYNFSSFIKQDVDSRTGTFIFSYALGQIYGKNLSTPFTLTLNYSQNMLHEDYFGFGNQWMLNLTHYDPKSNMLYLNGNQTFKVKFRGQVPYLENDKGLNVRIRLEESDQFVITTKDGHSEYLNSKGRLIRIRDRVGNQLHFNYDSVNGELQSITDDDMKEKMNFHWAGIESSVFRLAEDGESWLETKVALNLVNNAKFVGKIYLPQKKGEVQENSPAVTIHSGGQFPFVVNAVTLPSQATLSLQYIDLLAANNQTKVKAVSQYMIDPGQGQPKILKNYDYDSNGGHNYLAHNSNISFQGGDPLYGANQSYKYRTAVNDGLKKIWTTYNKYHLMEKQEIYDVSNLQTSFYSPSGVELSWKEKIQVTVQKISNWFLALFRDEQQDMQNADVNLEPEIVVTFTYPEDLSKPFFELPNHFAFPIKKEINIKGKAVPIVTYTSFNENGNLVSATDAFGVTQNYLYCGILEENEQCKSDGSGFERTIKTVSVSAAAKTYSTDYYYKKFIAKDKTSFFLLAEKSVQKDESGNPYLTSVTEFNENPSDDFYGYPTATSIYDGISSIHNQYLYQLETLNILIHKSFGKQGEFKTSSAVNKFVNKPMYEINSQGIKVKNNYDHWGRILSQTTFPDTEMHRTTYYEYFLNEPDEENNFNYVIKTTPDGYKTKTVLDGLGREIKTYKLATDSDGSLSNGAKFIVNSEISYDEFGHKKSVKIYNTIYHGYQSEIVSALTELKYDIFDRNIEMILADGVRQITSYDPAKGTALSYTLATDGKKSPIHQKLHDQSGRVLRESILHPISHAEISFKDYSYDHFGRVISIKENNNKVIEYRYDSQGKLVQLVAPDGGIVEYGYNIFGKVTEVAIVGNKNTKKILGSREYDHLGRLVSEKNTQGFATYFQYNELNNLSEIQIPKGDDPTKWNVFKYTYNPITQMLESKSVEGNPSETVTYLYDKSTLSVVQVQDKTGTTGFSYFTDGLLKEIKHTTQHGIAGYQTSNYSISYSKYDRLGNVVSFFDANQNVTVYNYNKYGRVNNIHYFNGSNENFETVNYTYDGFNRLQSETFQNANVSRDYSYDELSRLAGLTNKLNGKLATGFQFSYFNDSNLQTRIRENGEQQSAKEEYFYDKMNNLQQYSCAGNLCPKDVQGNRVTSENYTFDEFNNIASVTSSFLSKDTMAAMVNTTAYHYDEKDPHQLKNFTNSLSHLFPNSLPLGYDANGHVISDEKGNKYSYNELGQTISIQFAHDSSLTHFVYDYSGRQVLQYMPNDSAAPNEFIYGTTSLANERKGNAIVSYLFGVNGKTARYVDNLQSQKQNATYFAFDQAGSIVNEMGFQKEANVSLVNLNKVMEKSYTPYGIPSILNENSENTASPNHIANNSFGFQGQRTEPISGLQFLGDGYRAYSPTLKHFMATDSLSPFGKGGINGYSFANNNPIMFQDPSGHFSIGAIFGMIIGFVAAIAITVLTAGAGAALVGVAAGALGVELGTTAAAVAAGAVDIAVGAVAGAATSAATQTIQDAVNGKKPGMDVLKAAGFGALGGALGSFVGAVAKPVMNVAGKAFSQAGSWVKNAVVGSSASWTLPVLEDSAIAVESTAGKEIAEVAACPAGVCDANSAIANVTKDPMTISNEVGNGIVANDNVIEKSSTGAIKHFLTGRETPYEELSLSLNDVAKNVAKTTAITAVKGGMLGGAKNSFVTLVSDLSQGKKPGTDLAISFGEGFLGGALSGAGKGLGSGLQPVARAGATRGGFSGSNSWDLPTEVNSHLESSSVALLTSRSIHP